MAPISSTGRTASPQHRTGIQVADISECYFESTSQTFFAPVMLVVADTGRAVFEFAETNTTLELGQLDRKIVDLGLAALPGAFRRPL